MGKIVVPRLLNERSEDGRHVVVIDDSLTLRLQKSSVLAERIVISGFDDVTTAPQVIESRELEKYLYEDPDHMASLMMRVGDQGLQLADVRVCSEHFDSDRDYRRLPSVLRDAGQTMKNVYLKPDAIPSLRLPPTAKRLSPAKDPAVPTSKRRRTENDEPVEVDCFERTTPREHSCHCRHRPATRDTAVQADLHENPGPAQTPRPPGTKDSSVGTDRWLGKRSTEKLREDSHRPLFVVVPSPWVPSFFSFCCVADPSRVGSFLRFPQEEGEEDEGRGRGGLEEGDEEEGKRRREEEERKEGEEGGGEE
ncbi:hypothetical protein ISCGN_010138 [Ixodes scapularis]